MLARTLLVVLFVARTTLTSAQTAVVAVSPKLFEYHSAFWVNLHHFLYERARGRAGHDKGRAIVAAAVNDTVGEGSLSRGEREGLERALRYYVTHLASRDVLDRDMARLKATLGDQENVPTLADAAAKGLDDSLMIMLDGAAPVYRRVWWPRHDSSNRRWVAGILPLVAVYGDSMVRALTRDFDVTWSDFLIRVDASGYANWAGAYTTTYPDRITVATYDSSYWAESGLEMLFHESLHTLDASVAKAMSKAAAQHGKKLPPDFTHAMIFYTAGEVARQAIPGYEPYGARLGIWSRGNFPEYRLILSAQWLPFLDGRGTFLEAIDRVALALP